MLDVTQIRKDFPIYSYTPDLVYLDSNATSLKPHSVLRKLQEYYSQYSANVFRGVYKQSEKATAEYEESREVLAKFIHAPHTEEIIFTKGTTESLNMLMYSLWSQFIPEDEILTTIVEHHSNFVPWQQLSKQTHSQFKVMTLEDTLTFSVSSPQSEAERLSTLRKYVNSHTKVFAVTYVSNTLGCVIDIPWLCNAVKQINPVTLVIVDAAQAVPHMQIDVQELGCDFLAFSGHKMLGPTGVGVLWGKKHLLEQLPPFQFGGEMIREVGVDGTTFADLPHKFEAGTPAIAEVIAFKEAVKYLQQIGFDAIREHEHMLLKYAIHALDATFENEIHILLKEDLQRAATVSFTFGQYHSHDIAQILDENSVCVRAGHHCTMPLHRQLGLPATTRASMYLYNDTNDIDRLVAGLKKVKTIL